MEYIKRTKARYYEELAKVRAKKYAELRERVTDQNGVVQAKVQPPKIGLIGCMNLIIKTWRENDFSKVPERFKEIRMCTHEQGKAMGWTPQQAFHDYNPTEEEKTELESILPPSVKPIPKRDWSKKKLTCLQPKCSRQSYFGFEDEKVPRFCSMHKLEGMVEIGEWKPSFSTKENGLPRHVPMKRTVPSILKQCEVQPAVSPDPQTQTCAQVEGYEQTPVSVKPKKDAVPARGKGKKKAAQTPSREGSILQFLSPSSQGKEHATVKKEDSLHEQVHDPLTYPPLLQPTFCEDLKPGTVKYLKGLWGMQGEVATIEGVSIGVSELSRLFHIRGPVSYMNDNIVDGLCLLLNPQEGDFWIFQSHLVTKFQTKDPFDRWVGRAMKKWATKWGKGHVPRRIFFPFAVGLHYRVIFWDTHRDRVVYIDPLHPLDAKTDDQWKELAIAMCVQVGKGWTTQQVAPPHLWNETATIARTDGWQ